MRYPLIATVMAFCLFSSVSSAADPTLIITEARRGNWSFTGLLDQVIVDDVAGCDAIPWRASWIATPDDPSKTIVAYRYGWDIQDLNDDEQWSTPWGDYTEAPPRSFYFGTHILTVETKDDTGAITRGTIRINVIPVADPSLEITEQTRGTWWFVGLQSPTVSLIDYVTEPPTPWVFEWQGFTCVSNSMIDAYRYGWDIQDPDDDTQWTPWGDDTHAEPRTFFFGTHNFMVEVRDNTGLIARSTIVFEVRQGPVPVRQTTWGGLKSLYRD